MILRRFMTHVGEQNWFAVGLDITVVIAGIFLGMQVTEWNEDRKEGIEERRYLERLLLDAEKSIELQVINLRSNYIYLGHALEVIETLETGKTDEATGNRINELMRGIGGFVPLRIERGTATELLSSGLALVRDMGVRRSMQQALERFDRDQKAMDDLRDRMAPKLAIVSEFTVRRYDPAQSEELSSVSVNLDAAAGNQRLINALHEVSVGHAFFKEYARFNLYRSCEYRKTLLATLKPAENTFDESYCNLVEELA